MRIAFCVIKHIRYGGGIEKFTYELGRRLAARGHDITVYSTRHYGRVVQTVEGMRIVGVPSFPLPAAEKLTASVFAAARTLIDPKADIVHFHHVSAGWTAWLARFRGAHCLLQAHSVAQNSPQWGTTGSVVLRMLEELAVRSCNTITAVSPALRDHFIQRYGREVLVIPPGVDLKPCLPPEEIRRWGLTRNSYILYVGRLSMEKGADLLINAFRALSTPLRLVIVGDSHDASYKTRLTALAQNDPRIRFIGFAGGRLLQELYSNARLFVLPSLLEGLSLALLEAMSYSLPCLVSDIPENLTVLDDAGFTFRSGDARSLSERLAWLLGNPESCAAAGLQGQTLVRGRYTWDATTNRYESLYAQCGAMTGTRISLGTQSQMTGSKSKTALTLWRSRWLSRRTSAGPARKSARG
ncbi:MAG: glycosyltransferase family 4 protein [Planctomycetota bacterium]|nr:glycosyltransferase family 4 protein [Planctomycetota bacterium]